mgnify:FL=1|tara:strand:- start:651 stop:1040 length:390 start_codon:yes stop_codon:yes gene_type:complete
MQKINIPANIEDEFWEVTDPTQFVRTYNALRRQRAKIRMSPQEHWNPLKNSVNIKIGQGFSADSYWFDMTNRQTEELLTKHANAKPHQFRDCVSSPIVRFKISRWDIAVWPCHESDYKRNKDNNWGRDE